MKAPAGKGLELALRLTARAVRGDYAVWDHLRQARVFKSVHTRGGVRRMQKLRTSLVGAHGCQRFSFSKPVYIVVQNIVVHGVPAYMASTYLVPAHCTSFTPNVFNSQRWNVY